MNSGTEARSFTDPELARLQAMADQIAARFAQTGRSAMGQANTYRTDMRRADFEALRAEWAVADALGLPRRQNVSGPDGGVDLVSAHGETIGVRARARRDGDLLCPANNPMRCEWVVLVVPAVEPHWVEIVGGCTTATFYLMAERVELRPGAPTHLVRQQMLKPWAAVRARLLEGPENVQVMDSRTGENAVYEARSAGTGSREGAPSRDLGAAVGSGAMDTRARS